LKQKERKKKKLHEKENRCLGKRETIEERKWIDCL
jgi:hypothetical protein